MPGATVRTVAFQQLGSGRPLDDVTIEASNADGSEAVLEIQAKRSLTFTKTDGEFADVVKRIWAAAQTDAFKTQRYELAVAIARSTTRIETTCQETLFWARQLPNGAAFAAHLARKGFASSGMREFVDVFRENLAKLGAPTDDETVWALLRRFQILVFDFESVGSDYDHRAREKARAVLAPEDAGRAADLWSVLIDLAGSRARAGGAATHAEIGMPLAQTHGFRLAGQINLRPVTARLSENASDALNEIKDQVGGVRLSRVELTERVAAPAKARASCRLWALPGSENRRC